MSTCVFFRGEVARTKADDTTRPTKGLRQRMSPSVCVPTSVRVRARSCAFVRVRARPCLLSCQRSVLRVWVCAPLRASARVCAFCLSPPWWVRGSPSRRCSTAAQHSCLLRRVFYVFPIWSGSLRVPFVFGCCGWCLFVPLRSSRVFVVCVFPLMCAGLAVPSLQLARALAQYSRCLRRESCFSPIGSGSLRVHLSLVVVVGERWVVGVIGFCVVGWVSLVGVCGSRRPAVQLARALAQGSRLLRRSVLFCFCFPLVFVLCLSFSSFGQMAVVQISRGATELVMMLWLSDADPPFA